MKATYYFDFAAIVIMVVLLFYQRHHSMMKNERKGIFLALMLLSLSDALLSVTTDTLLCNEQLSTHELMVMSTIVTMLKTTIAPLYALYVVDATDTFHKIKSNKLKFVFSVLPYIVMEVFLVLNVYNEFIFTFNESGDVVRNPGYIIIYATEMFYGVVIVAYIVHCKRAIGSINGISLSIPVVLVAAAMLHLALYPDYEIVLFVVSMCFLLLLLLSKQSEGLIDPATGFFTQVAFVDDFRASRIVKKDITIIILTITNYKTAIDIMGYEKVQELMVVVAARIRELLDAKNLADIRYYYHDEGYFTVTAPAGGFGTSDEIAHKFAISIMKDIMFNSIDLELYANVCLVSCPQDIDTLDGILMLMSDLAHTKPSKEVMHASDLIKEEDFELRKQMSKIIDRAILNNYFSVYYQPIYSVKEKNFHSAEALVRLIDPEYGFISPAVFIPVAEKTGAIHKIGSFVLEEVCKFVASEEFDEIGLKYIEVNLSAAQCLRRNLIDEIVGLAEKYNISPKKLNLEITETAECYSQDRLLANIVSLNNRGYSFSLDDFGTGYSNLLRMASLPLNIIKLDRTFVCMDEDPTFHSVITNMVALFKEMGLEIVVEGIETKEMIDNFASIDVDYIQGFYFSKPLPKDKFIEFIEGYNNMSFTGKN